MSIRRTVAAIALLVSSASAPALAEDGLRVDPRIDLPLAIGGTVIWVGSEAFKPQLAAESCRWCGSNSLDERVRRGLLWKNTEAADFDSNITGFLLAPLAAGGMDALAAAIDGRSRGIPVDLLVILEATALSADLNQLVKFSVGRERPFVHALADDEKDDTHDPADNNASFYSGHTNLVFALAVSSGTVASMRNYRSAPWVWGVGLSIAVATGWLRIAADRHYFTDVMTGAVVGSAIGFAIPYYFHHDEGTPPPAISFDAGRSQRARPPVVALAWVW